MSNVVEIESVLFKRVEGGHVFQLPNRWIFGSSTRFLVNDSQKAELVAIMTPRRPILTAALIIAGILLWTVAAASIVWAFTGHDDPTGYDVVAMTALILVPMFLALMMGLRRNLRRMQPILAGLPRTHERISGSDRRQAMATALSRRQLLLIVFGWSVTSLSQVFILVERNARHPLLSDAQSVLHVVTAIIAAGLMVNYLIIAIRKAGLKQTT